MNYFISNSDGIQKGPFSHDQLLCMRKKEQLPDEWLIWHEGMASWVTVRAFFETETHARTNNKLDDLDENMTLGVKFKKSAQIAQNQALLTKLKNLNLPEQYFVLGKLVRKSSFYDAELKPAFQELNRVEEALQSLLTHQGTMDEFEREVKYSSLKDKISDVGKKTRKMLEKERLVSQRKKILQRIGEISFGLSPSDETLQNQMEAIRQLKERIESLEDEIKLIGRGLSCFHKHPFRILVAIMAIMVVWWSWGWFSEKWDVWQQSRKEEQIRVDMEREIELAEKKTQEQENNLKLEAQRYQHEQELQEQKFKLEEARRIQEEKSRIEEERLELERQRSLEKEQEQQLRDGEKAAALLREEQQRQEEVSSFTREQANRKMFLKKTMASLQLEIPIILSSSLIKEQAQAVLRMNSLEELKEAQKDHDWLGMYRLMHKNTLQGLPDVSSIESAVGDWSSKEKFILLRTASSLEDKRGSWDQRNVTYLLNICLDGYRSIDFDFERNWKKHPDGTGYLTQIRLHPNKLNRLFIIKGTKKKIDDFTSQLEDRIKAEVKALETKVKIGEMDAATKDSRLEKLYENTVSIVQSWCRQM